MSASSNPGNRKRGWRFWTFVVLNVVGLILIFPLLKVAFPLVGIWWNTRSQESARQHYKATAKPASAPAAAPSEESTATAVAPPPSSGAGQLQALTNQLQAVDNLSDKELQSIVAKHFGVSRTSASATEFDLPSAVFDSISRTTLVFKGQTYYGYLVDLVDQNGRHKTNVDCFTEPNADYERSLATMQLINNSAQLKKIYRAMASGLAEKSSAATNQPADSSEPVLRLDPGAKGP
jgi:hypothetical protein